MAVDGGGVGVGLGGATFCAVGGGSGVARVVEEHVDDGAFTASGGLEEDDVGGGGGRGWRRGNGLLWEGWGCEWVVYLSLLAAGRSL